MFDKIITRFEDFTAILCFSAMSIITLLGVFFRYVLSEPLIWGEEVSRYFMIWGIFIGISIVTRKNAHLGLDVIESFAPLKISRIFGLICGLILIVSYIVLFSLSVQFVIKSMELGQLTPILRIKFYFIYLAMPLGFLLSSYRAFQLLWWGYIKEKPRKDEQDSIKESEVYL